MIIVLLGWIGGLYYWYVIKPKLDQQMNTARRHDRVEPSPPKST